VVQSKHLLLVRLIQILLLRFTVNSSGYRCWTNEQLWLLQPVPPSGPNVTDISSDPTPCTTCRPSSNCPTCTTISGYLQPSLFIIEDGTYVDLLTQVGFQLVILLIITLRLNTGNVTLTNVKVSLDHFCKYLLWSNSTVGAVDSTTFTAVFSQ
jgi:hypothetical protein